MADGSLTIARRELQVLKAEKTIVLALLIQVFIAAFSSFLVVGLVSLYDPGSVQGYQVDVALSGSEEEARELLGVMNDQPGVRPVPYETREAALAAFQDGDVEAVLVAQRRDGRTFVRATVPDSNIETTVTVVQVREVLQAFERTERTERASSLERVPLDLPRQGTSSPYFGFTYTVLVPLLLFLPVFISGSLAVDSLTEERDRGTLELLRVAPVSFGDIVDGKLLAAAGLAPTQAALWVGLLRLNGTSVSHPALLVAFVASLALLVVSVALALAIVSPDRRTAQLLYSVAVLLVFGGSTVLPVNPANVAARLAIDSADPTSAAAVGAVAVAGAGAYLGLRWVTRRVDPATLS
ncbi:ABC transporter permease [Salinigranum halophilum]|uniref:ABC transporter permease n=1 Tax=Salinigranum halophilum TaxID=2565931 RepID=UPI00115C6628|nr:ABC transporter permease [Salinigranum halophilum]